MQVENTRRQILRVPYGVSKVDRCRLSIISNLVDGLSYTTLSLRLTGRISVAWGCLGLAKTAWRSLHLPNMVIMYLVIHCSWGAFNKQFFHNHSSLAAHNSHHVPILFS